MGIVKNLEPKLTANALTVLEKRYLLKDGEGKISETPGDLFYRVASTIADVESRLKGKWTKRFFEIMVNRRFLPNSPTLMNAGKEGGQLSACFVIPIQDSLDSIFDALKSAAKIHQSGGGTGFSFSNLRPEGSWVRSSQGVASGPVSFMRIFDVATDTIKQGGTRRGANMAILRVDHPDILKFIDCKKDYQSITNFNISVGITDEFMRCVKHGLVFDLVSPQTQKAKVKVVARELFSRMVQSAWECGDPGLVFLDRINRFNPTPQVGLMESTNPCGEQPLLPFESCNLGSLNLERYLVHHVFDWKLFREDIHTAVRFLDNVIEANTYPVKACETITLKNRKIGLGVMGFADLLLMMDFPYGSPEAFLMGERIMSFLDREAKRASAILAVERGAFPNWKGSLWSQLGYPQLRNATVSTVAPTGTISIIAGASSGIEPLFSAVYTRNVLDGKQLIEVHPTVQNLMTRRGISLDAITEEAISSILGPAWTPSSKVTLDAHVTMQSVFQRHSDSAVSKTINLPQSATVADVEYAYRLAYDKGCKGITVYRDQSRPTQVLEHGVKPVSSPIECLTC